jgi:DNA-binding response OmpR family regulator
MDGYKVIHGLHQSARYGDIVLIGLLTQDDGYLGRLKIRLAGAKQYLVKPLRTEEVLSVLSALLRNCST